MTATKPLFSPMDIDTLGWMSKTEKLTSQHAKSAFLI